MAVSCAVGESVSVNHRSFAVVDVGVNIGNAVVGDADTAVVGDYRDEACRFNSIGKTADGIMAIGGRYAEIFRNHMVSVAPSVGAVVDGVSVDEGRVAAAVGEGRGIGSWGECHSGTAVGDGRQGGDVYLGEAVNRGGVIVSGREAFRVQCVSVGPDGIVSCAVGVAVAEYNRSGTVAVKACGAIHKHRSDGVATDISDGVCRRTCHIHQTSYGRAIISRHIGDDFRQSNVIGECPIPTMSCTVGESVGIYNVALTAVETAVVHSGFRSRKRVAAAVGDDRFDNIVFNCVC